MTAFPVRRLTAAAVALTALALVTPVGSTPAQAETGGGVTVAAPEAGTDASVTVSKTDNLVNQTVEVSWKGFRPSSATRLDNSGDSLDVNTLDPVRVYQCRGDSASAPVSATDCYGAPGFRGVPASDTQPAVAAVPGFSYPGKDPDAFDSNPDGPANWQDTVTGPDGTGEVSLQVFTKRESAALGCDADVACSIVVVPNYGRPGTGAGATEDAMDAPWAWERRVVIPLHFLPTNLACPLNGSALDIEGSPFAARVLASWRAKTCVLDSGRVRLDYTSIGEDQTRGDLTSQDTGAGLVVEPLDAEQSGTARPVYAPVAATSLVVAFQVDDAEGKPVRSMKLNARLVAKLVTASYRIGGDAAVAGNPVNIFRDKEFLALNPGVDWPSGAPGNHPLLLGDISDATQALSRWLASDPDARAFINGTPDPWGMKVNTHYRGKLDFDRFESLDPLQSDNYQPIQGLDGVARQLSIAQFPGAITTIEGGVNVVAKPPRQNPGRREVFGLIDAASAADFRLSTASLENTGGAYVAPDAAGILAGLSHAKINADKVTRSVDLASKDKAVYPLSLLVSTAVSAKATKAVRTSVNTLLDYVAGPGQVPGDEVGRLPDGYVPLPAYLRKLIPDAQKKIAAGYTAPPVKQDDSASPGGHTTATAGGSTVVQTPVAGVPQAAPAVSPEQVKLLASTTEVGPQPLFRRLLTLPFLLALGLLASLAGPVVAGLRRLEGAPAWLRR
jgi:hypothetical protein